MMTFGPAMVVTNWLRTLSLATLPNSLIMSLGARGFTWKGVDLNTRWWGWS